MTFRRLFAIGAIVMGLAPGTWLRTPPAGADLSDYRAVALAVEQPAGWPDGFTLAGAWTLQSDNPRLGGLSALARDGEGNFLAWSDRGDMVRFSAPGRARPVARLIDLPHVSQFGYAQDIESAAHDPATGTTWFGLENPTAIRRLRADGTSALVRPEAMRGWGSNSGAEAMARLADGRFVALAERSGEGLLFAGDPAADAAYQVFRLADQQGWLPTDMAALPDGRLLVLSRRTRLSYPPFASRLAIGDPAAIEAGAEWPLTPLLTIERRDLVENYEGLAVEPLGDGRVAIWLVSDDNLSAFQRTLLLRLVWRPEEETQQADTTRTARGASPRTP